VVREPAVGDKEAGKPTAFQRPTFVGGMADPAATTASAPRSSEVPVGEGGSRTTLLRSPVGLVEDYRRDRHERTAEGFCDVFQVCFPYRGLGIWHVGRDDVVADANQVLFVRAGEAYRLSGPVPGGYGELILTPDVDVLSQIAGASGVALPAHPSFRRRCGRATPFLQAFRTRFRLWAARSDPGDLEADEVLIALLRAALQDRDSTRPRGEATARLIRRTKQFLQEQHARPIRLLDVARAVGASPAYLTDAFHRSEGVPLHRYLVQLRLARALPELPHASDLTALALRIGFSSHSHFSAAFRRAFGCTPSRFREGARRAPIESF
jgi:AraC family transcriptional regulator